MVEIIVIAIMLICNLVLANEWAIHGLWEIGLQRPPNKRAINAALIGMLSFAIGGAFQKYGHVQFVYLTEKMLWQTGSVLLIPPVLWIFIKRAFFLAKGKPEFNRATARMKYWLMQYYRPGQILEAPGALLAQFSMALETLNLFERSIEEQKKAL